MENDVQLKVAAICFRRAGKIHYYKYSGFDLNNGDLVVVEADKGYDLAIVAKSIVEDEKIEKDTLKKIIRKTNEEDFFNYRKNIVDSIKALEICKKIVANSNINMKLLKAEYTLDRLKLTFYYTSDGRIDFRQLVKDLARVFKTRIEMRQVGVRDSTKILGGIGICGREICCCSHLRKFDNISITMAKDQNLILNPSKITGLCGRLMCCLLYEKDLYALEALEAGSEFIKLVDDESGGDI